MHSNKTFKVGLVALLLAVANLAFGQVTVGVRDAQGLPGQEVEVEIYFLGNDNARTYQFDVTVNLGQIEGAENGIDVSRCLENAPTQPIENCVVRNAPNEDTVRVGQASFTDPMPDIDPIGVILYTIDSGATVGDIINLNITDFDVENVDPGDVTVVNGQIEVIDVPPEDLSELSVTPDPLAFGTIDLGNMPVTDTVTAENTGGSNSSLTISGVVYSGDTEFSVVNDACTGSTLNIGDTCDVTVEFNAGANGNYTGQLDFSSDANTNPNPTVSITGAADSVPNLTVNPPFGPVNLGTGLQGSTVSANGSISNSGSAPGDFDCTLNDPNGVYSTSPSPLAGTVPAGGSVDFTLSCTLPDAAEDGDTFAATLSCTGDITGTHDLSCGVSEFEPLPVPTMQKWGLIVLTLMMLMIGGLSIRFFRA